MSVALPRSLDQSFRLAAAELGMCSAAWLFADEVAAVHGEEGIDALRDALGRVYPVLDTVLQAYLEGKRAPAIDGAPVVQACAGAERLVIVGVESLFLDALLPALPELRIALLAHAALEPDWQRVADNLGGRVELVTLGDYQRHAGSRSVLMTFVYGGDDARTFVLPSWARASGDDVRTQFRALLGWDVLGRPFYVYPRWLVEVPRAAFTHVIGGATAR